MASKQWYAVYKEPCLMRRCRFLSLISRIILWILMKGPVWLKAGSHPSSCFRRWRGHFWRSMYRGESFPGPQGTTFVLPVTALPVSCMLIIFFWSKYSSIFSTSFSSFCQDADTQLCFPKRGQTWSPEYPVSSLAGSSFQSLVSSLVRTGQQH